MTRADGQPIGALPSRWQFSLSAVFLLMLIAAAFSALYRVAPQLDVFAAGIAVAAWSALNLMRRRIRPRKRSRLAQCGFAVSWFAGYVVSVGPAIALVNRFVWTTAIFEKLYWPLAWLHLNTPARRTLEWYAEFWRGLG